MAIARALLVAVVFASCSSPAGVPCSIEDAELYSRPLCYGMGLLLERAAFVRSEGGIVVYARRETIPQPGPPRVWRSASTDDLGYYLAQQTEVARYALVDPLGHPDVPEVFDVRAWTIVAYVATESGEPLCFDPGFPGIPIECELNTPRHTPDSELTGVLMLLPDEHGLYLHRRARPFGEPGEVQIVGGDDVAPMDDLRL